MNQFAIYDGQDPRHMPWYRLSEAAHYLRIPDSTVRSWVSGREYPTAEGIKFFQPLVQRPSDDDSRLSFQNLTELHVLRSLRENHRITIPKVRDALDFAQSRLGIERLLLSPELKTAAGDLFIERFGTLLNLSQKGQTAMLEILQAYLERIERDSHGVPVRLLPVTRTEVKNSPKLIAIDPTIAFGSPITIGSAVKTSVIADRFKAGESLAAIAEDYGSDLAEIEEAIRFEQAA